MANNRSGQQSEAKKSLGERFMDHARGPMGLASIVGELKFAVADIRHKVVEEGWFGRAVTPRWYEPAKAARADAEGIHGKTEPPSSDAGGVHSKREAPSPDGGNVHGLADRSPEAPAIALPGEEKGLGMSYAELEASWANDYGADHAAISPDHERTREPEQSVEP